MNTTQLQQIGPGVATPVACAPVSFNQDRRLAFEEGMRARRHAFSPFNIGAAFRLAREADASHIEAALNAIVQRHPALRVAFEPCADQPERERFARIEQLLRAGVWSPGMYRQVLNQSETVQFVTDSRNPGEESAAMDTIALEMFGAPVNHGRAPLVRAKLATFGTRSRVLFLVLPHLIADRRSLQVFADELAAYLAGGVPTQPTCREAEGHIPPCVALEQEALRRGQFERAETYWLSRWEAFAGAQVDWSQIPFAFRTPAGLNAGLASERVALGDELSRQLRLYAQSNRMTVYMVCLAALGLLLQHVLGKSRVVIRCNLLNRSSPRAERAMGWFAHSHMLGIDLDAASSIRQLLDQTRRIVAEAMEHQHLPLGLLWHRRNQSLERGVKIVLDLVESNSSGAGGPHGLERLRLPGARAGSADLIFEVRVGPSSTIFVAHYSTQWIGRAAARALVEGYRAAVAHIFNGGGREQVAAVRPGRSVS